MAQTHSSAGTAGSVPRVRIKITTRPSTFLT
jgi:hypothetical protein